MQGFRSSGSLQRFVPIFSALRNLFVPPNSQRSAFQVHLHRLQAIAEWKAVTGTVAGNQSTRQNASRVSKLKLS
jgi:putative transposase